VLTGALFRLPLGIWTDRFGGRIVMFILLLGCAVPLWLSSYAAALWQFLLLGLALGLVGASFAVGTPYTSRFFPKEKKGLRWASSAGVTGAAINMFVAPQLVASYGWQSVPRVYAVALLVTAALFWLAPHRIRGNQAARCRFASNWPFCAIGGSGNIANTTRSSSGASRPFPSGCPSTSSTSTISPSLRRP
jgi:Nitrate/nitrite transporter